MNKINILFILQAFIVVLFLILIFVLYQAYVYVQPLITDLNDAFVFLDKAEIQLTNIDTKITNIEQIAVDIKNMLT